MEITALTTEHGVNIDERVADGRTVLFNNQLEARKYASHHRSYPYPVYCNKKTNGQYAVPK